MPRYGSNTILVAREPYPRSGSDGGGERIHLEGLRFTACAGVVIGAARKSLYPLSQSGLPEETAPRCSCRASSNDPRPHRCIAMINLHRSLPIRSRLALI